MKLNIMLYLKTIWYAFFKSEDTPGRLTLKRFFVLLLIFLLYPLWHFSIRISYGLDKIFFPQLRNQDVDQPIFIVGNFRSGTTLLHRLLAKDPRFTGMKAWEIYLAPSVIQRKFYNGVLKINRLIGNPIQKIIKSFEKILQRYAHIHQTSLNTIEEDGQIFLHLWSTYNLFAFFPFPELIHNYIYYDDEIPESQKAADMSYYQGILKRHIFSHKGKRYISKSPTYSAKVRTLHKQFPDAKFINLVRSPLRVIPSSVSMFSQHWRIYGEPKDDYPQTAPEVMCEQAKFWYIYPHQYLKSLPADQYIMVRYQDLTLDPKSTIEEIYKQLGIEMTPEYRQILIKASEKAKKFKSNHHYSLKKMGLSDKRLTKDFALTIKEFKL